MAEALGFNPDIFALDFYELRASVRETQQEQHLQAQTQQLGDRAGAISVGQEGAAAAGGAEDHQLLDEEMKEQKEEEEEEEEEEEQLEEEEEEEEEEGEGEGEEEGEERGVRHAGGAAGDTSGSFSPRAAAGGACSVGQGAPSVAFGAVDQHESKEEKEEEAEDESRRGGGDLHGSPSVVAAPGGAMAPGHGAVGVFSIGETGTPHQQQQQQQQGEEEEEEEEEEAAEAVPGDTSGSCSGATAASGASAQGASGGAYGRDAAMQHQHQQHQQRVWWDTPGRTEEEKLRHAVMSFEHLHLQFRSLPTIGECFGSCNSYIGLFHIPNIQLLGNQRYFFGVVVVARRPCVTRVDIDWCGGTGKIHSSAGCLRHACPLKSASTQRTCRNLCAVGGVCTPNPPPVDAQHPICLRSFFRATLYQATTALSPAIYP